MIEQQFLTTFNNLSSISTLTRIKDKKNNLIIDFINGTYQGNLTSSLDPDGLGIAIDDQFNFIFCSNWQNGKINGVTFIKLASQICLWGLWNNNMPKGYSCIKIGAYLMFVPYTQGNKLRRPKKCLVYQQGKQKMYITTIERYPQHTQTKRQYSIVIQKIIPTRQKTLAQALSLLDMIIPSHELTIQSYLHYISQQQNLINLNQKQNGLLITGNYGENCGRLGCNLGLLLDKKKFVTKSVGTYLNRCGENSFQFDSQSKFATLNGIGLSKTMQSQIIIGIFKDDMLIRQLNAQDNIDTIRSNTKNYTRNLNGSVVKQLLGHEHMKSMSYKHNYLYFPQIKKIVAIAVQLHKYVEMFERLSHQEKYDDQINESMHHPTQKYQADFITKQMSSSGSIIDQYPEFKVNLKKQVYRQVDPLTENHNLQSRNQLMTTEQNSGLQKKPGFIFSRTTRNANGFEDRKPRSPSGSPSPKLNRKLEYSKRSPLKSSPRWKI